MWDVIFLSLALSMDAFAVSIGLGAKQVDQRDQQSKPNGSLLFAARVALYFGIFQGVMPLIGFIGGHGIFEHSQHEVLKWIMEYSYLIAFVLLAFIGGKMIYESFAEGIEEDLSQITPRILLVLAIATSIDAMAAGFSLPLINFNPFIACLIIGVITLLMSFIGVFIGKRGATWLESKAEFLGGVVLVLIAFKLLLVD